MKAERFVWRGWTVRLPRKAGGTFVAYASEPVLGRVWFKTRREARAYIAELKAHLFPGGMAVRARVTFDVDQV